jgi:hypothetical protein
MTRRKAAQPALPGIKKRYVAGRVERHSVADIQALHDAGRLPLGSEALADSFKLLAREVDRAESEGDRWGKAKTVAEMRYVWTLLAGRDPGVESKTIEEWLASLPKAPVGDPS